MEKKRKRSYKKKPDAVTRAGAAAANIAEKALSKAVNSGLNVLEGILRAVGPFSK